MSVKQTALLFTTLVFAQVQPAAADDSKLAAIKHLGELNGIALQCKALSETQRMKRALVVNLPKRRQLGELFDYETNRSFMAFIKRDGSCPSPEVLREEVDHAIAELETLYKSSSRE
jgi:hypothetical protein